MRLQLIYNGKALDNNEISPKDLSVAVLSFDLLLEEANSVLNDSRAKIQQLTSPLLREGVEDVAIKLDENKTNFCQIIKEEVNYFKCLVSREIKLDEEPVIFKTSINIINLSFKEDNKWYVNDGQSSFYVLVEDDEFLSDINAGKEFAKGDILKVRIRREQFYNQDEKKLKTEHFIEEVLEHVKPQRHLQGNLF